MCRLTFTAQLCTEQCGIHVLNCRVKSSRQRYPTRGKGLRVNGDKLPLVVVSHGRGGDSVGLHDTAEALADAGFVVAAINHPVPLRT